MVRNMAKYIRFERDEDVLYLQNMFDRAVNKIKNNVSTFDLDQAEIIYRVHDALHSAADVSTAESIGVPLDVVVSDKLTTTPKAKSKKKSQPRVKSDLCKEHPYYGAVRAPQQDCDGCWNAYKKMNPNTYSRKRSEFERNMAKKAKSNVL
jgi:hypothetical protein